MGCRLPGGVNNPSEFWTLLRNGTDAITEIPPNRWDINAFHDKDPNAPGKMISRYGGFIKQTYDYDAPFFNISPREAHNLDPLQYLLLEVGWESLENAALSPNNLNNKRTGVFLGVSKTDNYIRLLSQGVNEINAYLGPGNASSVSSGRIAYFLNLRGPNFVVDTACSSSLVALHLACQSLLNSEIDCALCGGANRLFLPYTHIGHSKANMLSPDGRCKTFDAAADGYVRSEACGMVVLKRLEDALADEDRIAAVICSSAVNSDGLTKGLTVPSEQAQKDVIRQAIKNAGLEPEQIFYLEAHGTGTTIGDPIEANALGHVFKHSHTSDNPLLIGSVKSNLGHTEAAAGIVSLIKSVLILQNRQIPPSLHFIHPNPKVPWDEYPLKVATKLLPCPTSETKRYVGINSFGFSGTNAHVILEPAPTQLKPKITTDHPQQIFTLSAHTDKALFALAARYKTFLQDNSDLKLEDICFTTNTGRALLKHRLALTADSTKQVRKKLAAFTEESTPPGLFAGKVAPKTQIQIAFLFTGQGSLYAGMGYQLYETQPIFRQTIDRCQEILQPYMDESLLDIIGYGTESDAALHETVYTQPVLFALEYALFKLWTSWGIKPAAVMGHSAGEYTAACVAGVFSLEDGLKLAAARGRTMYTLCEKGDMLVLPLTESRVEEIIQSYQPDVSLAAVNGPGNVVISGRHEVLETIKTALNRDGIKAKNLSVSHAFHSAMMEPMLPEFRKIAAEIEYAEPKIPLCSNVYGEYATADIATPEYWCRHVRQPVRFAKSMEFLSQSGFKVFLEIGPNPVLLGMGRLCLTQKDATWLLSLRQGQDDCQLMLDSLAQLYIQGAPINWLCFYQDNINQRQKIELPTYPFQRRNYLLTDSSHKNLLQDVLNQPSDDSIHPFLGQKIDLAGSRETRFEAIINVNKPSFLNDHIIFGSPIVPAAVYWEMALSAGFDLFKSSTLLLENISISQALILTEGEEKKLQCVLSPEGEKEAMFQIYSQSIEQEESTWDLHASGKIKVGSDLETIPFELERLRKRCPNEASPKALYDDFSAKGLDFGPQLMALQKMWMGKEEVLGRIELPDILDFNNKSYLIHPVLLDSCIRVANAARPKQSPPISYLPLAVERLAFHRRPGRFVWTYIQERPYDPSTPDLLTSDINILDESGSLVAEIVGYTVKKANAAVLKTISAKKRKNLFFQIGWLPQARPQPPIASLTKPEHWLIFADSQGTGKELAEILEGKNQKTTLVVLGKDIPLEPWGADAFSPIFARWKENSNSSPGRVIVLLDPKEYSQKCLFDPSLDATARNESFMIMFLFQALVKTGLEKPPKVWVVTRGTRPVEKDWRPLNLASTPVWGMMKSINLEHPELNLVQIDLPSKAKNKEAPDLLEEILSGSSEDQIALRDTGRYVARLLSYKQRAQNWLEHPHLQPYRLEIEQKGNPGDLRLMPCSRREPDSGEVEILVRATGLNFKDVLNILGMYPGDLGPPGGECAGEIVRVGEGVRDYKPGDSVLGVAPGSFAKYVTVAEINIVKKPENLNFAEAASIPITFLTVYYCLKIKAQISAGDRILIHTAAGGVGLAAIQIAQLAGAEIFATASPEKWQYLKSLGIKHIMNSRTTDFSQEILKLTNGEGVDIVLNSLSGEFITHSFSVLKPAGRFLEIGKRDVWDIEKVKKAKPDASYFLVDLALLIQEEPARIRSMLTHLIEQFRTEKLKSLPLTLFPLEEAVDAFRFMQQARHIGKIVITQPGQIVPFREDSTYLITGGLGGLGIITAAWMAKNGAGHLALVGRSAPSTEAKNQLKKMEQAGSRVTVFAADVSRKEQISAVIDKIKLSLPPLRGIIHAAGVIDDGIILNQTQEQFSHALNPKIGGSLNLHNLTLDLPLDFFIFFSSVASLVDNPGRSSYAAANTFMDTLAHERWKSGLPGFSINWGPWSEVGMAADIKFANFNKITPDQGMQILEDLFIWNHAQEGVFPLKWTKFFQGFPADSIPAVFSELVNDRQKQIKGPLKPVRSSAVLQRIKAAAPRERPELIQDYLGSIISRVLRLEPNYKLDPQLSLNSLGMDSLMATETAHQLANDLEITLPIYEISGDSCILDLVEKLCGQYLTEQASPRVFYWIGGGFESGRIPIFFLENLWIKSPEKDIRGISIEELAADYVAQISGYQKKGPYYLGGFSIGGLLSLEIARQLKETGEEVPLLFLVDPATPGDRLESITMRAKRHVGKLTHLKLKEKFTYLGAKSWLWVSKGVLFLLPFINFKKPLPTKLHFHYALKVYDQAALKYNPPNYTGKTIIYSTKERYALKDKKWHSICSDVETHVIDTEGHLDIADPPWNEAWLSDLKTRI